MHQDDKWDFAQIYEGAKQLFLEGEYDRAVERFKSIYEVRFDFRDVGEIIHDYYATPKDEWIAKFKARFNAHHGSA
jgi:hypothetical protein